MTTMEMEAEKTMLIRELLKIDDADSLKRVKQLLQRLIKEKTSGEVYQTKEEILKDFGEACEDMKLAREGKLKGRPLEDLLNEL
jgi:hypothetical protein